MASQHEYKIDISPKTKFRLFHTLTYTHPKNSLYAKNISHILQDITSGKPSHTTPKMLYTHATLITVNATREILFDGAILVQGNLIADIGKTEKLLTKYPDEKITDLIGRIIIPGLVCTHMHCAQTLLRGACVFCFPKVPRTTQVRFKE